jgi:hypothetical protein
VHEGTAPWQLVHSQLLAAAHAVQPVSEPQLAAAELCCAQSAAAKIAKAAEAAISPQNQS